VCSSDLLQRIIDLYEHAVWLNPIKEAWWDNTQSIGMMQQLMGDRMYPMTIDGLDRAMRELSR